MKFCIVHYNTPELTACLCSSIKKQHDNPEIIIFDNSDKRPFKEMAELFGCTYFDNTKGQLINFNAELEKFPERNTKEQKDSGCNFGSVKHALSIDWLCTHLQTDNFILCDSDILLIKPVDFMNDDCICCADVIHITKNVERISPMLAFINAKKMRENGISFFDGHRMHGLVNRKSIYHLYDTGASFLEDIKRIKLFKQINTRSYFVHYGNGSWRHEGKSPMTDGARKNVYENIPFQLWLLKHKEKWG